MNHKAIKRGDRAPCRSPSVEKALRELEHMSVTEACVSGSCDICLHQTDPCNIVDPHRENSHPSSQSGEKKNR